MKKGEKIGQRKKEEKIGQRKKKKKIAPRADHVNVVKEKWVLPARNRWIQLASPRLRCLQG
jgi:hypothetical protein